MKERTYNTTKEGTVVVSDTRTYGSEDLLRMLGEIVTNTPEYQRRKNASAHNVEATWGPYDEQLSDTEFRYLAYESH